MVLQSVPWNCSGLVFEAFSLGLDACKLPRNMQAKRGTPIFWQLYNTSSSSHRQSVEDRSSFLWNFLAICYKVINRRSWLSGISLSECSRSPTNVQCRCYSIYYNWAVLKFWWHCLHLLKKKSWTIFPIFLTNLSRNREKSCKYLMNAKNSLLIMLKNWEVFNHGSCIDREPAQRIEEKKARKEENNLWLWAAK